MIFEEMKNPERKAAFLRRRGEAVNSDPAEVEAMAAYILTDRFDADLQRLIEGDWYFEPPSLIFLRKGKSQKRRKVYRFTDENRILLQYLSFMLFDRYDDLLPDTLYSFRKNKPCWQLYRSVRRSDPRREKYVIKVDIHKFGESIDPGILEGKLKRWLSDEPEVCSFIMWLITRNVYYRKGKLEKGFTSVLPGNPTAAFLQNIFLEDIDRFMAENACVCSRYCDDIFMICEDPGTAGRLMDELGERIAGFGLSLNEEKSGVVPPGEAYDLLGIRFAPDAMDIADCTYAKICGRMKHRADNIRRRIEEGCFTREEGLELMATHIHDYYYGPGEEDWVSWTDRFFPYITTTERLARLDHLSQECLRYVAVGRRTNAKYRYRYQEIRVTGYVPLVRAYYSRLEHRNNDPRRGGP